MNKQKLIAIVSKKEKMSLDKAKALVDCIIGAMSHSLCMGERIEIRGFGSLKVKTYREYTGRNPKTGVKVNVASKSLPQFKSSKILKRVLNNGHDPQRRESKNIKKLWRTPSDHPEVRRAPIHSVISEK